MKISPSEAPRLLLNDVERPQVSGIPKIRHDSAGNWMAPEMNAFWLLATRGMLKKLQP